MAEVRGDECLPQGWKVEVRVRKSGRKDRYYTDPASGHVFRSLRDIDRYLLTGKFGRHAMKSKNNEAQVEVVAGVGKRNSGRSGKRKGADASNEDSTYLSAPEIALLLARQMPHENASNPKSETALDSPLTSSWQDICSDPCIEFAIKTLTGAIPLQGVSDAQMGNNRVTDGECPPA